MREWEPCLIGFLKRRGSLLSLTEEAESVHPSKRRGKNEK
jgi:hypothetical protein